MLLKVSPLQSEDVELGIYLVQFLCSYANEVRRTNNSSRDLRWNLFFLDEIDVLIYPVGIKFVSLLSKNLRSGLE